jgi:hypothetical protein
MGVVLTLAQKAGDSVADLRRSTPSVDAHSILYGGQICLLIYAVVGPLRCGFG